MIPTDRIMTNGPAHFILIFPISLSFLKKLTPIATKMKAFTSQKDLLFTVQITTSFSRNGGTKNYVSAFLSSITILFAFWPEGVPQAPPCGRGQGAQYNTKRYYIAGKLHLFKVRCLETCSFTPAARSYFSLKPKSSPILLLSI